MTPACLPPRGEVCTARGANKVNTVFDYNDWNVDGGRLLNTISTQVSTGDSLQNLTYDYDSVGNINMITDTDTNVTPSVVQTQTFTYDDLDRLLTSNVTGGSNGLYSETYSYDSATGNLASKGGVNYTAYDANHKHAVTNLSNGNSYAYDANGNMTSRNVGGQSFTLNYDAENRLVSVSGPSLTASFTYDGDGRRVKSVVNSETILFAGGHFEQKGNEVTKYYFAGASRIAVRKYVMGQTMTLTYLGGDHLGSTSLAVNASTGDEVQTRYKPWGEVRYTTPSKTLPTRYTFTGQYSYVNDDATDLGSAGFGLMFYREASRRDNARFYDPQVGRFTSADTVVPGGVQGLDRYAYTANNPVRYADPSGHMCEDPEATEEGEDPKCDGADYVGQRSYSGSGSISLEDIGLIQATIRIRWGFTDDEGNDWAREGLGTVVGDRETIVTADHILKRVQEDAEEACGCEVSFVEIYYDDEWHRIDIGDLDIASSGDALTITLPESETLPAGFIPATPGESYQPQRGQSVKTVYQDEHGNLHVATTTLKSPLTVTIPSPSGPVWPFDNPNGTLNGGDSGGGVFYNGQLIGVNSSVWNQFGVLWIAPYNQ